jgi:hypothetical protein
LFPTPHGRSLHISKCFNSKERKKNRLLSDIFALFRVFVFESFSLCRETFLKVFFSLSELFETLAFTGFGPLRFVILKKVRYYFKTLLPVSILKPFSTHCSALGLFPLLYGQLSK